MKNSRLTSILSSTLIAGALTIGSLASTPFAAAQNGSTRVQVNIPFSFQSGGQQMPAGVYRIGREPNGIVLLQGPANASEYVLMHSTTNNRTPVHGKIVFDRYGDKYFLRQIWTAGDNEGLECPKSRAEKETLQAQNKQAKNSVELALNSSQQ
jgi:hypothetical protein